MLPITVVLPVYHRVLPEQFRASFASVVDQTEPVAEIIVVADGPLPDPLEDLVTRLVAETSTASLERLEVNSGTGIATNLALAKATQPWFARQDADDISLPDRFEKSWRRLEVGDIAGLGGALAEFEGDPSNIVGIRRLPATSAELARYVRVNCPINTPTSIVSVEAARAVGGIRPLHLMEDYDLFARLVAGGYRLENLPETLVLFRADPAMFQRRRDAKLIGAEWQMQRNLHRYGLVSRPRSWVNFVARMGARLMPAWLYAVMYQRVFRNTTDLETPAGAPPAAQR